MIVVAGEALIDRIVSPDGSAIEQPGGGPFNTARAIGRLGVPVAFLGCLSTDPAGRRLREALVSDRVDLTLATTTDAPTTLALAEIGRDGGATYRFATEGTSAPRLDAEAVRDGLATGPAVLHVGSLGLVLEPMATAIADGVSGASLDTLVMMDPNCRPTAIVDRAAHRARCLGVFRRADVVKASRDDLGYLWPARSIDVAIEEILDTGALVVIVTDGARPVACHGARFGFELPVREVEIVDTVGAGDAFSGGFLARWTERRLGRDGLADEVAVRDAVLAAIQVAGETCRRSGADPPRRDELLWPPL